VQGQPGNAFAYLSIDPTTQQMIAVQFYADGDTDSARQKKQRGPDIPASAISAELGAMRTFSSRAGWVNLESCAAAQRMEFSALRDESPASASGAGIRWPTENAVDPQHNPISRDQLTERAYHG
jgi:hypothetical protein